MKNTRLTKREEEGESRTGDNKRVRKGTIEMTQTNIEVEGMIERKIEANRENKNADEKNRKSWGRNNINWRELSRKSEEMRRNKKIEKKAKE